MNDERVSTEKPRIDGEHGAVAVTVNGKRVVLTSHRVTGMDVKMAAIDQGVEIQLDFLLTFEAHEERDAQVIPDNEPITVTKHSVFTANDADDDS